MKETQRAVIGFVHLLSNPAKRLTRRAAGVVQYKRRRARMKRAKTATHKVESQWGNYAATMGQTIYVAEPYTECSTCD